MDDQDKAVGNHKEIKINKKMNTPNNSMERNSSEKSAANQNRRRRLLKGVALTPAIFTLHSGSARAMLSNMRCITKTHRQPRDLFRSNDDDWHNEKVPKTRVNEVHEAIVIQNDLGDDVVELVPGGHREVLVKYGRRRIPYDTYGHKWDTEFVAGELLYKRKGKLYKHISRPKCYTRVYVDTKGEIVGRGPASKKAGYRAVSDSCWDSFA